MFELLILFCAFALSITGSLFFWPVTSGLDFYKPVVLFLAGYVLGVFVLLLFILIHSLFLKKMGTEYQKPNKMALIWIAQCMSWIALHSFVKITFIGKNRLPAKGRFLIVSNHRSFYDSVITTAKLGMNYPLSFVTKASNMDIPVCNKYPNAACYSIIHRKDPIQSLQVMKRCQKLLEDKVTNVVIYPEGTRQQAKTIGEFHEGVFNVAIKANVPIVVLVSKNADIVRHTFPKISKVTQAVIGVIYPSDYEGKTAKEVSNKVKQMMVDFIEQ